MKHKILFFILKYKNFFFYKQIYPFLLKRKFYKNNTIVLIKKDGQKVFNPKIKGLEFVRIGETFNTVNNYIEFNEPLKIRAGLTMCIKGNNNTVKIGGGCNLGITRFNLENNTKIIIGGKTSMENTAIDTFGSRDCSIIIGKDCMLGHVVHIRTSDAHIIYDINTKELINPAHDVIIGDHVWIAMQAAILKGATIPSNCVIGAKSLVNKKFEEENCIIAGTPAKVVKRNVNWLRQGLHKWDEVKNKLEL